MKVDIDLKTFLECVQFAHNSIETNIDEYKRRSQENITKILNDIILGKMGEYGVYLMLTKKGLILDKPDIQVYSKEKKSFDADLAYKDLKFHIKSQSLEQSLKYNTSWSFQPNDKLIINPTDNDMIFLCQVSDLTVNILSYHYAKTYKPYYSDPQKMNLRGKKKVLYYEDFYLKIPNKWV